MKYSTMLMSEMVNSSRITGITYSHDIEHAKKYREVNMRVEFVYSFQNKIVDEYIDIIFDLKKSSYGYPFDMEIAGGSITDRELCFTFLRAMNISYSTILSMQTPKNKL